MGSPGAMPHDSRGNMLEVSKGTTVGVEKSGGLDLSVSAKVTEVVDLVREEGELSPKVLSMVKESEQLIVPKVMAGDDQGVVQKVEEIKKKSWVNVVQRRVLTNYDLEVKEINRVQKAIIPRDVFIDAKPLWEDFLIGKFLSQAPQIAKIHVIVNKIWTFGDRSTRIYVFEVNSNTVKFRVRNSIFREKILRRGMWNIADIPMVVSKWSPFNEEAQPAIKSIPMWIDIKKVPPTMFTDKGLSCLARPVGKPIRFHPSTEACLDFDVAKVFVEADLTKELPKTYCFWDEDEEKDVEVEFFYPWLPPRCETCGKWGHTVDLCISTKGNSLKVFTEVQQELFHGERKGDFSGHSQGQDDISRQHVTPSQTLQTSDEVQEKVSGGSNAKVGVSFESLAAPEAETQIYISLYKRQT